MNSVETSIPEDFFRVQSFRYVAGEFFSKLGAQPEAFSDIKYRAYLPVVYGVLEEAKNWLDWESYLQAFSRIQRSWWLLERRGVPELPYPEGVIETDLDHMILWACFIGYVYDPHKRWLTDENLALRTRAILMFLLHEADELIAGDKIPEEPDYEIAKENALKPARILLAKKYRAHPKLLEIWDEFNAQETELAQNIDFLDHETTVYKASRYDWEFWSWKGAALTREFAEYYAQKHRGHPDVWLLQQYVLEHLLRFVSWNQISGLRKIAMQREMWQEIKAWGDAMERVEPGAVYHLSRTIVDRFTVILPK
jgi:5'-deoxynucleotidase YfbR-like HD superfamily hydrolase